MYYQVPPPSLHSNFRPPALAAPALYCPDTDSIGGVPKRPVQGINPLNPSSRYSFREFGLYVTLINSFSEKWPSHLCPSTRHGRTTTQARSLTRLTHWQSLEATNSRSSTLYSHLLRDQPALVCTNPPLSSLQAVLLGLRWLQRQPWLPPLLLAPPTLSSPPPLGLLHLCFLLKHHQELLVQQHHRRYHRLEPISQVLLKGFCFKILTSERLWALLENLQPVWYIA